MKKHTSSQYMTTLLVTFAMGALACGSDGSTTFGGGAGMGGASGSGGMAGGNGGNGGNADGLDVGDIKVFGVERSEAPFPTPTMEENAELVYGKSANGERRLVVRSPHHAPISSVHLLFLLDTKQGGTSSNFYESGAHVVRNFPPQVGGSIPDGCSVTIPIVTKPECTNVSAGGACVVHADGKVSCSEGPPINICKEVPKTWEELELADLDVECPLEAKPIDPEPGDCREGTGPSYFLIKSSEGNHKTNNILVFDGEGISQWKVSTLFGDYDSANGWSRWEFSSIYHDSTGVFSFDTRIPCEAFTSCDYRAYVSGNAKLMSDGTLQKMNGICSDGRQSFVSHPGCDGYSQNCTCDYGQYIAGSVTVAKDVVHGTYTFKLAQGQIWNVSDKDCTPDCGECCLEPITGTAEFCLRRVDQPKNLYWPWKE